MDLVIYTMSFVTTKKKDKSNYSIKKDKTEIKLMKEELEYYFSTFNLKNKSKSNLNNDYQKIGVSEHSFGFLWRIYGINKFDRVKQFKEAILLLPNFQIHKNITYHKSETVTLYKGKKY